MYLERARPLLDLPSADFPGDGVRVGGRQMLFHVAWLRDDIDDAKILADELAAIWRQAPPERAALIAEGTARKFIALGQLDRATEIASSMLRNDGIRELILGSVALSRQDPELYAQYLDEHGIDASYPTAYTSMRGFVLAGRARDARETLERFRDMPTATPIEVASWEASVALAEGHPEQAIMWLQPILAERPDSTPFANDLADAWVALGEREQAIHVLEHSSAQPRERTRSNSAHHYVAGLDRLARLYREVERLEAANIVDDRLRLLLRYADDDHPIRRRLDAVDGGG
jgi:tetratricopeptide (TPR) repeat protein